jgi:hypothetical protein
MTGSCFDKLSTNGYQQVTILKPFALSLSKGAHAKKPHPVSLVGLFY